MTPTQFKKATKGHTNKHLARILSCTQRQIRNYRAGYKIHGRVVTILEQRAEIQRLHRIINKLKREVK